MPTNPPPKAPPKNTWVWPASTTSISGYKYTSSHHALDIGTRSGSRLMAPTYGKITKVGWDANGYGLYIVIKADSGETIYLAHLKNAKVKAGQTVMPGEVIGSTGSTGNSTGPHLHYEIRTPGGGGWINPYVLHGNNPSPGQATTYSPGSATYAPGEAPAAGTSVGDRIKDFVSGLVPGSDIGASVGNFMASIEWVSVGFAAAGVVVVILGGYVLAQTEGASFAGKVVAGAITNLGSGAGGE